MRALLAALLAASCVLPVSQSGWLDVRLLSDELIGMGGTMLPQLSQGQIETVSSALESQGYGPFDQLDRLITPEGIYNGTYQDDEIDLLNELYNSHSDSVTVFGVSQSAGVISMAIQDLQDGTLSLTPSGWGQDGLVDGLTPDDLPKDIHWVALAPPDMPVHGNASGLGYNPTLYSAMEAMYPNVVGKLQADGTYTNQFVSDSDLSQYGINSSTVVYCGEYDPICDMTTSTNPFTNSNNWMGLLEVHGNYANLTPDLFSEEIKDAQQITDLVGGTTPDTQFYLLPDLYNFGTAQNPDYDSLLPSLAGDLWLKPFYESQLPYYTLLVDSGYADVDHPFDYYIDGTEYTFAYDPATDTASIVQVGDGVDPLDVANLSHEGLLTTETLASDIAVGQIDPTDIGQSITDPSWWIEILNWFI